MQKGKTHLCIQLEALVYKHITAKVGSCFKQPLVESSQLVLPALGPGPSVVNFQSQIFLFDSDLSSAPMETGGRRENEREAFWFSLLDFRKPSGKIIPSPLGDHFEEARDPCFKNSRPFGMNFGNPLPPLHPNFQPAGLILYSPSQHSPPLPQSRAEEVQIQVSLLKTSQNTGADTSQEGRVMSTFINK